MAHTPGPWAVIPESIGARRKNAIVAGTNEDPTWIGYAYGSDDDAANARLIAAAPDLLDWLKTLVAAWDAIGDQQVPDEINDNDDWNWDMIRAAIDKAEGRS